MTFRLMNPERTRQLLAGLLLLGALSSAAGEAFAVRVVSSRPGHCFTDSDKPDVRVKLTGAAAEAVVEYAIAETDGPWQDAGKLEVPAGAGEARLPLRLPGRGLYRLTLSARSGTAQAKCETWIAVVFTPAPPAAESPWGIFYTPPVWFDKDNPHGARDAAFSHRLLGASWSRFNFWAHSFGKVTVTPGEKPAVTADYALWKEYARALRKEGLFLFGEISQCPRELSSRPDEKAEAGDAGPVYNRVKPKDYALWDALMEKTAADFAEEIQVWEVWNEANLKDRYWTGTVPDFAELVEHTSRALRKGNPKARIAAAGFVDGHAFADQLFGLGLGKHIDILSVHYTDERPGAIEGYRQLLRKHKLDLPIWNSEEKSEVPLRNLAGGIERSFKFIHVEIGYPEYRPLLRKDWTVLPAGILFSVGSHCLDTAKCAGKSDKVPGHDVYFFQRGDETVGVFDRGQKTGGVKLFGSAAATAQLAVEPLAAAKPEDGPRVTDALGRTRPLAVENGRAALPLSAKMLFVNGCRKLEVLAVEGATSSGACAFEAEAGRFSKGWNVSGKEHFSGGRILELWAQGDPGPEGYWAELKIGVARAGRYEVLFSGNSLARLKPPRSISPFAWKVDDGPEHAADGALPVTDGVAGAPEGLGLLGALELAEGEHTFRLKLTGRRDEPDRNYALWFDAIGLRPAK